MYVFMLNCIHEYAVMRSILLTPLFYIFFDILCITIPASSLKMVILLFTMWFLLHINYYHWKMEISTWYMAHCSFRGN